MPSGFLILSDGRCFAPRWAVYDAVLCAVAQQLDQPGPARELGNWLLTLLPGPDDEKNVGHGPWLRKADEQLVERFLDVRELTPENQRLFHQAARQAATQVPGGRPEWLVQALLELADMVNRAERGEPPLSRSHWREVVRPAGRQLGPGWTSEA